MKRILRITGIILVVLIVILALAGIGVVTASNQTLNRTYEAYTVPDLTLPEGDELDALITEGEHIYGSRGCTSCHGSNGSGAILIDDPALGVIRGSNLTTGTGGVAENYETTSDWIRAIQHGVRPDGTSLFIMPSGAFTNMHETEMLAVIAYMENLDPVDNDEAVYQLGPIGHVLIALGEIPAVATTVNHDEVALSQVERTVSVEYGATLGLTCAECHGEDYGGAASPDGIWAPNLTVHENGFVGQYTFDQFVSTLRTGQTPDGTVMDAIAMPFPYFGRMTDTELEALYLYLQAQTAVNNPQPE